MLDISRPFHPHRKPRWGFGQWVLLFCSDRARPVLDSNPNDHQQRFDWLWIMFLQYGKYKLSHFTRTSE